MTCEHRIAATDVHVEDHRGVRDWPMLVARCKLVEGHTGPHAYGSWIDPRTNQPAFEPDERGKGT